MAAARTPKTRAKGARYHHGDLRRALIDASLELIVERGPEGFTMREVARRVGVSHAAPYRHFADRSALLEAVSLAGFAELYEGAVAAQAKVDAELGAASKTEAAARARLRSFGAVYLRFAAENPARYRVMFGRASVAPTPGVREAGGKAFDLLVEQTRDVLVCAHAEAGTSPPDDQRVHDLAMAVMSGVHGLATLALDGMLGDLEPGKPIAESQRFATLSAVVIELVNAGLRV